MATFAGFIPLPPDQEILHDRVTDSFDRYDADYYPFRDLDGALDPGANVRTVNLPVSQQANLQSGVDVGGFGPDDWYNGVHIIPQRLDLGNLASRQTRFVEVWNAYFAPNFLSSVTEVGTEGIALQQPEAAPTFYGGLESRLHEAVISLNGPPIIDAVYTFNFETGARTLEVVGNRVVVWPFMPQTKHREVLEWQTDILTSFNREQRLSLRSSPRQSFSHEFQLDPHQFSRAKAITAGWSHRVYGIPVWAELTYVGALTSGATAIFLDTGNADYRDNDLVLVWESDAKFAAVEILTVMSDRVNLKLPLEESYQAAYVAPVRFARTFDGVQFRRSAIDYTIANATFQVTQNKDLGADVGYPQYRGKDVLTDRTVLVGDLNERISRSVDVLDNGSGPIAVDIKNNWATVAKTITFDALTRAERWVARRWVHSRRGKQRAFWLPSWNVDLVLVEDISASGLSIIVRPIDYSLYYDVKDIMIQLKNGSQLYARVLSGARNQDGDEELTLESPIGAGVTTEEVDFVSFMTHVRFNADRIEISHDYAGRSTISIPVVETPE